MFLSYSFCHSKVVDHFEIDNLSVHVLVLFVDSFSRKTLDTIVKLYFCRNSPVQLLILAYDY